MNASATTTASVVNALTRKHGATPIPAISSPASGGPTTLGELNATEFKPIAPPTYSRGTISGTQLWRAGASNDCVAAFSPLVIISVHSGAWPLAISPNSTNERIEVTLFVMNSTRRRG